MKRFLLFLPISLLVLISCKQQQENLEPSALLSFADSLFQASVDGAFVAGASVIVLQGDDLLLDKSYGFGSLELGVPVPLHASFEIGSVTKQFTAAAILKLEEMGKLSLQDDFTQYVDFDTKGRSIPIQRLLDHTSGIASYTEIDDFWELSIHEYERDTLLRIVEQAGFLFEPGEALIYNNSAYFILGLIIEKVSGKSYEAFLEEQFFGPLDMKSTYYCSTSKVIKNKVYGYGYSPDGLRQKAYLDHTWPYAAGSLCSTTADQLKWLKAIHQDDFLGKKNYKQIITPGTLADGTPVQYAKGLLNQKNYGNHMISHGGGINGFLSESRYFPESDLYIVCLVNTTGPKGAGFFAEQLTWKLLKKEAYPSVDLDLDLESLTGQYTGPVRGRKLEVTISAIENGLSMLVEGSNGPDTLNHYIGNHTWIDGNNSTTIANNEVRIDQGAGYYILKRE